jgi:predicted metal-dependent hydrolase
LKVKVVIQITHKLELGNLEIDVVRKNIKNIHLRIYPPAGRVQISAPLRMNLDTIRVFAVSKLDWIEKYQHKIRSQIRSTSIAFSEDECHYIWGKCYLLNVIVSDRSPSVKIQDDRLLLQVHPDSDIIRKRGIIDKFYYQQMEVKITPLITKWEKLIGVSVARFTIRKMKTKWGSCTPGLGTIRFNLELAKKPVECLEYVVVHELVHLLEPSHNHRFVALMDSFLPNWQLYQAELD